MWPYFLIIAIVLVGQYKLGTKYDDSKWRYFLVILLLFLFAAARGNGDGDYFVYLVRGKDINSIPEIFHNTANMEIGYCLVAYIVNKFGLSGQGIIFSMNLISFYCINHFIEKHSDNPCLSVLVFIPFFFQFDMHAARTAVAMAISVNSISFALERKPIKFAFIILLAMTFHNTAIICLGIYFLVYLKISFVKGSMGICAAILLGKIVGFHNILLRLLSILNLEHFYNRVNTYVNSSEFGYPFSLADPRLLINILFFITSIFILDKKKKYENLLLNIAWMNIIVLILFSNQTFIAYRLAAYYGIYQIVLIPLLVRKLTEKNLKYHIVQSNVFKFAVLNFFALYACAYALNCFVKVNIVYKVFL